MVREGLDNGWESSISQTLQMEEVREESPHPGENQPWGLGRED